MGLLDNLAGSVLGGSGAQGNQALIGAVMQLLQGRGGGLQGLVEQFAKAGLGDQVNSWVGTGANLPVSADQIQQALGGDVVKSLASQLGVSAGDAAGGLATVLPQLIDQLTPQGQVPSGDALQQGIGQILGTSGRR